MCEVPGTVYYCVLLCNNVCYYVILCVTYKDLNQLDEGLITRQLGQIISCSSCGLLSVCSGQYLSKVVLGRNGDYQGPGLHSASHLKVVVMFCLISVYKFVKSH